MDKERQTVFISFSALAVICGAAGALLTWGLTRQLQTTANGAVLVALIGWFFTLAGWFVSARLAERAQRRMFLNNLINSAREAIVRGIRHEQDWIGGVNQLGYTLQGALYNRRMFERPEREEQLFWFDQNVQARRVLYPERGAIHPLVMLLEEYELLFPETRRIRAQLAFFAMEQISSPYSRLVGDIMSSDQRDAVVAAMQARGEINADYTALLEDLRIHIQNASLAEITGRRIPARMPQDPTVPMIMVAEDGLLDIRQRGSSWPIRTWPPADGGWQLVAQPPTI